MLNGLREFLYGMTVHEMDLELQYSPPGDKTNREVGYGETSLAPGQEGVKHGVCNGN
jgi:hypothetical protein